MTPALQRRPDRKPQDLIISLVYESVLEHRAGHCSMVGVVAHWDGSFRVLDDGRGLPSRQRFALMAVSAWMTVETRRQGHVWYQESRGAPPRAPVPIGDTDETGAIVQFLPDPKLFPVGSFDFASLMQSLQVLAALNPELGIGLTDERGKLGEVISYIIRKTTIEVLTADDTQGFHYNQLEEASSLKAELKEEDVMSVDAQAANGTTSSTFFAMKEATPELLADLVEAFSKALLRHREERGLGQAQLAFLLQVKTSDLQRWESKAAWPTLPKVIQRVCANCGLDEATFSPLFSWVGPVAWPDGQGPYGEALQKALDRLGWEPRDLVHALARTTPRVLAQEHAVKSWILGINSPDAAAREGIHRVCQPYMNNPPATPARARPNRRARGEAPSNVAPKTPRPPAVLQRPPLASPIIEKTAPARAPLASTRPSLREYIEARVTVQLYEAFDEP